MCPSYAVSTCVYFRLGMVVINLITTAAFQTAAAIMACVFEASPGATRSLGVPQSLFCLVSDRQTWLRSVVAVVFVSRTEKMSTIIHVTPYFSVGSSVVCCLSLVCLFAFFMAAAVVYTLRQ